MELDQMVRTVTAPMIRWLHRPLSLLSFTLKKTDKLSSRSKALTEPSYRILSADCIVCSTQMQSKGPSKLSFDFSQLVHLDSWFRNFQAQMTERVVTLFWHITRSIHWSLRVQISKLLVDYIRLYNVGF